MTHYERYRNNQIQVGVLHTNTFGTGWSTWYNRNMAFDERLISWLAQNNCIRDIDDSWSEVKFSSYEKAREFHSYVKSIYGAFYFTDRNELVIEWLPKGTYVQIREYDGKETIYIPKNVDFEQL